MEVPNGWRYYIGIPDEYALYRDDLIYRLQTFKWRWNRHLGNLITFKHSVELDPPATRPIHSVQYCAVPKEKDFDQNDIDYMPAMNVNEPAQIKWDQQLWSSSKKTEPCDFALIIANKTWL